MTVQKEAGDKRRGLDSAKQNRLNSSQLSTELGRLRRKPGADEFAVEFTREQKLFIDSLNELFGFLSGLHIRKQSWMVIAGGGVFLYQLHHAEKAGEGSNLKIDRVPTDIDIVVDPNAAGKSGNVLKFIFSSARGYSPKLEESPSMHYGHILLGHRLRLVSSVGISIDITTELSQKHSPSHPFRPSSYYAYPPAEVTLSQSYQISSKFVPEGISVANPGYIAFYKLMLNRNQDGKQDNLDLIRLKRMGLLSNSPELHNVIDTMCMGDKELAYILKRKIDEL
ncbi:MAG: hypothetical protein QXF01_00325 [Candidatus Micrarchaeaceae archaeon]